MTLHSSDFRGALQAVDFPALPAHPGSSADRPTARPTTRLTARRPVSAFRTGFYRRTGKRLLDLALVLAVLPIVLPVVALLALLVALDGGRPFYRQDRIGRDGRIFRILKLRTMVTDADARLAAYLATDPGAAEEWATSQKLKQDPRITLTGRLLRKSSLDELPQLWNVLKGDMSLVGPRPMMVCQRDLYPGQSYFDLLPGVTGPWQVSDRNACSFADRAGFDDDYARELSLATDLRLLGRTVAVVLRGTGY